MEVRAPAKQRQTRWDRYLRKFNYMKALDAALEVSEGVMSER